MESTSQAESAVIYLQDVLQEELNKTHQALEEAQTEESAAASALDIANQAELSAATQRWCCASETLKKAKDANNESQEHMRAQMEVWELCDMLRDESSDLLREIPKDSDEAKLLRKLCKRGPAHVIAVR